MAPFKKCTRRSMNQNHTKRKTQFKMGHVDTSNNGESNKVDTASVSSSSSVLTRLQPSEILDVLAAASKCGAAATGVIPYKLRPAMCETKRDCQVSGKNCNENIIVNVQQLQSLLQASLAHSCKFPTVALDVTDRQGLCVSAVVRCSNCKFSTDKVDLFNKIKNENGRDVGSLNSALLLPVMKSRVGIHDQLLTLSCLNVKPPDIRGLQRKVNSLSDSIEQMNEEQMLKNQKYIKKIHELAGVEARGDVEYDVSYSRRPQQGCERATQSFAPLIDQTTKRPIAIGVANKLCCKHSCNHNNKECKRSFCTGESIQRSESLLLKETVKKVNENRILNVTSVTTDGSAQLSKAVREINISTPNRVPIEHFKCFIHKMRSLHGQLRKLKLTSIPKTYDRSVYIVKLASCLRLRVRLELTRIRKHFANDEVYIRHAQSSMSNIIPCFQGSHSHCRAMSMVCNAHLSQHSTKHLPYGQYVKLGNEDIDKLKAVLLKYTNVDSLKTMARLRTTNQCESMHSRVFRYAPKHTVWSRNFIGMCHSAVHSASLGNGRSLIQTAMSIGLPVNNTDPFSQYMSHIDRKAKYHAKRQLTHQYRSSRYHARRLKCNRKLLQSSAYGSNADNVAIEHNYGINPW